jgi:hypothetical protein
MSICNNVNKTKEKFLKIIASKLFVTTFFALSDQEERDDEKIINEKIAEYK